jgi:hypothetical protein
MRFVELNQFVDKKRRTKGTAFAFVLLFSVRAIPYFSTPSLVVNFTRSLVLAALKDQDQAGLADSSTSSS